MTVINIITANDDQIYREPVIVKYGRNLKDWKVLAIKYQVRTDLRTLFFITEIPCTLMFFTEHFYVVSKLHFVSLAC